MKKSDFALIGYRVMVIALLAWLAVTTYRTSQDEQIRWRMNRGLSERLGNIEAQLETIEITITSMETALDNLDGAIDNLELACAAAEEAANDTRARCER